MRRVGWVTLTSAVVGLAPSPAHADDAGANGSYALSWVRAEGAEDCPTGRALVAEVERRLGRAVFDLSAERSFEVQVTRSGGRYRSDVYVRDAAGRALGHRVLESDEPGCGALFGATALAVALVIDPDAAEREPSAAGVAAFEAPPATPPVTAPLAIVAPAPTAPPPAVIVPAPVVPAPEPSVVSMSVRAYFSGGMVPAASPAWGIAFLARPGRRWGFGLAGSYTAPQIQERGLGKLEIGLTRATATITFDAVRSDAVRLVLGAGPTLGVLHLAVHEPVPVTDPGDFWAFGADVGVNLQLAVTTHGFVELGGAAALSLRRQEFFVRGQAEPVWTEPLLGGAAFFGVGARFP